MFPHTAAPGNHATKTDAENFTIGASTRSHQTLGFGNLLWRYARRPDEPFIRFNRNLKSIEALNQFSGKQEQRKQLTDRAEAATVEISTPSPSCNSSSKSGPDLLPKTV